MKKLALGLTFLFFFAALALAAPQDEIKILRLDINKLNSKIKQYNLQIKRKKIKKAKGQKNIQALQKTIKAKEAKIVKLKIELYATPAPPEPTPIPIIASVEAPAVIAPPPMVPKAQPALQVKGGLGGGAPMINLEYIRTPFFVGAGYGVGNNYTLTGAAGGGLFPLMEIYFWGLTVNYMSYSSRVKNIVGMETIVSKGSHIGAGILLGRDFGQIFTQFGYNTAGGLLAEIGYKF